MQEEIERRLGDLERHNFDESVSYESQELVMKKRMSKRLTNKLLSNKFSCDDLVGDIL